MLENSLLRVILGSIEDKEEAHTQSAVSVVMFHKHGDHIWGLDGIFIPQKSHPTSETAWPSLYGLLRKVPVLCLPQGCAWALPQGCRCLCWGAR